MGRQLTVEKSGQSIINDDDDGWHYKGETAAGTVSGWAKRGEVSHRRSQCAKRGEVSHPWSQCAKRGTRDY